MADTVCIPQLPSRVYRAAFFGIDPSFPGICCVPRFIPPSGASPGASTAPGNPSPSSHQSWETAGKRLFLFASQAPASLPWGGGSRLEGPGRGPPPAPTQLPRLSLILLGITVPVGSSIGISDTGCLERSFPRPCLRGGNKRILAWRVPREGPLRKNESSTAWAQGPLQGPGGFQVVLGQTSSLGRCFCARGVFGGTVEVRGPGGGTGGSPAVSLTCRMA